MPAIKVPATRVINLLIDTLTAEWDTYTTQLDIENVGPVVSEFLFVFFYQKMVILLQTFVLCVHDANALTKEIWKKALKEEEDEKIPKEEQEDSQLPDGTVHTTATPSIVLSYRMITGSHEEYNNIHTYQVRDANEDDFERVGKKWYILKENIQPKKHRKL